MEVADQRVAAPARPHFGEGDRREHPHRHVAGAGPVAGAAVAAPVGGSPVVEHEARRRDGERAPGGGALEVERVARRPAPARAVAAAVALAADVRGGELGGEREQRVGFEPSRLRAGRGERAFERAAESAERGLRGRAGRTGERGGDEHPVVGQGEGRAARMQRPPAGGTEQPRPPFGHPPLHRACAPARRRPGVERRAEARARPVDDLHRRALGRGVGERARERAQRLGVDTGEGRDLDREADAPGIDVELARFVEGAPGQQRMERRRHLRRRPGLEPGRPLEQIHQAGEAHGSLQPAGSMTSRTQAASR